MFSKGATWQFTMGDNVNDGGPDGASAGDGGDSCIRDHDSWAQQHKFPCR